MSSTNPQMKIDDDNKASNMTGRLGCVSYLNSKPLIDGLEGSEGLSVRFDVPSRLVGDLERGEVDLALCPIVDYFRSKLPLVIVPVSGICCDGPTMTVCVYSQVPLEDVTTVHADTDSHTSVALMQVVLHGMLGRRVKVVDYDARQVFGGVGDDGFPQTVLLIGDKVVTNTPATDVYPHRIDLGQAWAELTGLPFVFATWLARRGNELGELPGMLQRRRIDNSERIGEIAEQYAGGCNWPVDLAKLYLESRIKYEVGDRQLTAIEKFAAMAGELGLIDEVKSLDLWDGCR